MKFDTFWKKRRSIKFEVIGRPPRKSTKSCWSSEGEYVLKLREKALEARNKSRLDYFDGPVKLELTVYDSNITNRKNTHDYHGDLDTLVAGVLDSLQPAPENPGFEIDPILKNRSDLDPAKPLIIKDDSQIVSIMAKKIQADDIHYSVMVESV